MSSHFPSPDHDHARCLEAVLSHADAVCKERRQRLTPMRRQVLAVLAESHRPLGAYDIIDRLDPTGPRPAPITVYRALDFLMGQGLAHRIESRNAFVACDHAHEDGARVAFLICEVCGSVGEAPATEIGAAIASAAHGMGFEPKLSVVEVTGRCVHCRGA